MTEINGNKVSASFTNSGEITHPANTSAILGITLFYQQAFEL